ncbi:uncharacterized protein [Arachis hypogaea]|uniref:uncharacterized protein isoform X1 n=1 Tax=Arachis hypogaea TaxID=3818 RepID=UPI000DEC27CB|nr:uncharacterized protein LOC112714509 isoform X1 [Arachis hypogaea]
MNMNMCSNTGNTGCGCGSSGAASMWSSGVKKPQNKRPRIPKRGPGVAELEKILREQENIDTISDHHHRGNNNNNGECAFSFQSNHHSNPFHHNSSPLKPHHFHHLQPPPPSSSPPRLPHVPPSATKSDHLVPTTPPPSIMTSPSVYAHFGRNGGGSSLLRPEQELFPMNLSSCMSKSNINDVIDVSQSDSGNSSSRNLSSESNQIWPQPPTIQKRTNSFPSPPMMNQFLGSGIPASSGSLPLGLHNHIEPPSNQSSYYKHTSNVPEEHKVSGMKRSHPSSLENSLIPPPNFQVSSIFSHLSRPHQSSITDTQGANGFTSANNCYRDAKRGSSSSLDLNNKRFNSDIGVHGQANFPSFATHHDVHPPPPPMHLFQGVLSKGTMLPYQVTEVSCKKFQKDRTEDSNHRSGSNASDNKPFYNFLGVKDPEWGNAPGSHHGRCEAGRCGIDLSLKL